jgi:DNA (cytosine-5)-methyltransferase 1
MADPRGNLALTFLAIVDRLRPEWVVWENVPGVLSSNGGRDFGSILGALAELGYGFSYRVLDAQHFGVAQRRRRVFLVANATDWRHSATVLFEPESVRGNLAKGAKPMRNPVSGSSRGADGNSPNPAVAATLSARDYKRPSCGRDGVTGNPIVSGPFVRRLTPVEFERLQGFPDDWTAVPWKGKEAPDTPRYKALGNSMAVPVMRWIGERISAVNQGVSQ